MEAQLHIFRENATHHKGVGWVGWYGGVAFCQVAGWVGAREGMSRLPSSSWDLRVHNKCMFSPAQVLRLI